MRLSAAIGTLLLLLSITPSQAMHFGEFAYFSDSQISPEGGGVRLNAGVFVDGRYHTNGTMEMSFVALPDFQGFTTQVGNEIYNLPPSQYDTVFQGGYHFGYDRVAWPPSDAIETIKSATSPEYTFPAITTDSLALTTSIKFSGTQFSVAQYSHLDVQNDTLYTMDWMIMDLPPYPGIIWVQGVSRIQGIVEGQVLLLSSDSLFIMDNLFVSDTDITSCAQTLNFGTVPPGSPNSIGLIGEKDVIVAATLGNGFSNGLHNGPHCGLICESNILFCQQSRKDIVITAAILALGCSFEVEFWNTTAYGASHPDSAQHVDGCFGYSNTHVYRWGIEGPSCPGAPSIDDKRGSIWLSGSLAQTHAGYRYRMPPSPMGPAWIGYGEFYYRHDANLIDNPPPFWPEVEWIDDDPPTITPSPVASDFCGTVEDLDVFRISWEDGSISYEIEAFEGVEDPETFLCMTIMDSDTLEIVELEISDGEMGQYTPSIELPETGNHELHVEIAWDAQVWNQYGDLCTWELGFTDVDEPPFATHPGSISLAAFPNPFNPQTQVSIHLPWADHAKVEVYDLLGQKVRTLSDASLGAGSHQFALSASDLSSGLYFVRLEACGQVELKKIISVQ